MKKIANFYNCEYGALLTQARCKLEGKWVRKKEAGREITGQIIKVHINADGFDGIKVDVEWKDWPAEQKADLRKLEEW